MERAHEVAEVLVRIGVDVGADEVVAAVVAAERGSPPPSLTGLLLSKEPAVGVVEAIPAAATARVLEALNDASSVGALESDPLLDHPVQGPLDRAAASVLVRARERGQGSAFSHLAEVIEAVGPAMTGRILQSVVLGGFRIPLPPLPSPPPHLTPRRSGEGREEDRMSPGASASEAKGSKAPGGEANDGDAGPALGGEVGGCVELLLALLERYDPSALRSLLTELLGAGGWEIAERLRNLRGDPGRLAAYLAELCADRRTRRAFAELSEILTTARGGARCRVRIEGPRQVEIAQRVTYRAHLESGEPGGTWHWDALPPGSGAIWLGGGVTALGGPAMLYTANYHLAGAGLIRVRYVSPSGQTCWAVLEIVHVDPPCLVRFRPQRGLLGYGQAADYVAEAFPEGDVEFTLTVDPAVGATHALTGRNQVRITAGTLDATVTIVAKHATLGCSTTRVVSIRSPESGHGQGEDAPACAVDIVDGPTRADQGAIVEFRARGRPPGGTYAWTVTPDSTIVGATDRETVRVLVGTTRFVVFVQYLVQGCTARSEPREVTVIAGDDPRDTQEPPVYGEEIDSDARVALVRTRDPEKLIPSVPLVQPVPNCHPIAPADGGTPLAPGADYVVAAIRVLDAWEDPAAGPGFGLQPIDLSALKPSVRVELRCEGATWDALRVIEGFSVDVVGQGTYDFAPNEYWHGYFRKWHPGRIGTGANVRVEGLGVHHLRFRPMNGIQLEGRYHLDVACELTESSARAVAEARRQLDDLLAQPPDPADAAAVAAHAARIQARMRNVVSAWREALQNVQVRSRHNRHVPHPVAIGQDCRFRVRGLPEQTPVPASSPSQVEAEPFPPRLITLERDGAGRLLSKQPHPSFFVTLPSYPDRPMKFENEGLLKGNVLAKARGYFPPGGATDEDTIYGVSLAGPACVEIRRPSDRVVLTATGTPAAIGPYVGQYTWSMVSWPIGASWEFRPPGPSPSPITHVRVDRPGYYVARVDYVVDDLPHRCNQTYAIVEFRVVMNAEPRFRLLRVGDYPAELRPHLARPFYRRRTLERQEGADLMVEPGVGATLGHREHLLFSTAPELRLGGELTARVYTKADRSEYRDYQGYPYVRVGVGGAHFAEVQVEALEPIHSIHLIRIRYEKLLELPGHAVEVGLTALPGDACSNDPRQHPPGGVSAPSAGTRPSWTSVVSDPGEPNLTPPERGSTVLQRVNLLLYEHDLGESDAGGAAVSPLPGNDIFTANVANGNLHYEVPLFAWDGRGLSLSCALHYNSFHAAQMEAVERMARLNGLSRAEREQEYASTGPGFGWSYTYGMRVVDYVLSEEGRRISKRLEMVDADGNHVQFEAEDATGGTYRPVQRGALFRGDAEVGASLVLREVADAGGELTGYALSDLYGNRWSFDAEGRLTEIATAAALASNGAYTPIRVGHRQGRVEVLDTVGRKLVAYLNGEGRIHEIEDGVGGKWRIADGSSPSLLGAIRPPGWAVTTCVYGDYHLLKTLRNGRFNETAIKYHERGQAWGRARSLERESLEWRARYDPVTATQKSTGGFTDARHTDHRMTWNRDSLSVEKHEVYQPSATTPLGDVAAGLRRLHEYEYFDEPGLGTGKLRTRQTDLYGHVHATTYVPDVANRRYRASEEKLDGLLLHLYTYDPTTRLLFDKTDANGRVTRHLYDRFGNLRRRELPALAPGQPAPFEEWTYAPDGSLATSRDLAGTITSYGYGGAGDPSGVGLPTTRTVAGETWTLAYRPAGLLEHIVEPFHQGRTDYAHDGNGRAERVTFPEIAVATDPHDTSRLTATREENRMVYDGGGNLERREMPGLWERYSYDAHDRVETEQDGVGTVRYRYDGLGAVLERTDRRGNTWTSEYDHLGRVVRILHPATSGGQLVEYFHYSDGGTGLTVRYVKGALDGDGRSIRYPKRFTTTRYDARGQKLGTELWTEEAAGRSSPKLEWIYGRDRYGHLESMSFRIGATEKYKETYRLDAWYRTEEIEVDGAKTTYDLGPLDEIRAVTSPPHGGEARATWRFGHDAHGRETTVTDPYGRLTREVNYHSASGSQPARVEYKGMPHDVPAGNPRRHQRGPIPLRTQKTVVLNARGLPVQETVEDLPPSRSYYDVRGRLVAQARGDSSVVFKLDPTGRRTRSDTRELTGTRRVLRRFDEEGNLLEVWGSEFRSRYTYDALDQLTSEERSYWSGPGWHTIRTLRYDVFGRLRYRESENFVVVRYSYDDARGAIEARVGDSRAAEVTVRARLHWNGDYALYERVHADASIPSLRMQTGEPDRKGRVPWVMTAIDGMEGKVTTTHHPAGTRWIRRIDAAGQTFTQGPYAYHPDWQVRSIDSGLGGRYTFRYRSSGALSSWRSPRGHEVVLGYGRYGGIAKVKAWRAGGGNAFAEGEVELFPHSEPAHPKERYSSLLLHHAPGEVPASDDSRYESIADYGASGLIEEIEHRRRGGAGPYVVRQVSMRYGARGRPYRQTEEHRFPSDPTKNFTVIRRYDYNGQSTTIESGVAPEEASLVTQHAGRNASYADSDGRVYRIDDRNLIDPEVFSFVGDPKYWLHTIQTTDRDELGRVERSTMRIATSRGDDPEGRTTWRETGHRNTATFVRGPDGRPVYRRVVVETTNENGDPVRLEEARLFLYDGADVAAELKKEGSGARVLRVFEYGPAAGFRLNVRHDRDGGTVVDEYLYGVGLTPVGLTDADGKVVRRFHLLELPAPGDDRLGRYKSDDARPIDKLMLSAASPLWAEGFQPPLGGLPPGVGTLGTYAVGSGLVMRPHESSLGTLTPPSSLVEDVHQPQAELVDPSELPRPATNDSCWGDVLDVLDRILSVNPMTSVPYRMAKGIHHVLSKGDEVEIRFMVADLLWSVVQAILKIPLSPIQPLEMWASGQDYGAADYILAAFDIRDSLVMINGYDPVSGATFSWDDRIFGAQTLGIALATSVPGTKAPRSGPTVGNGVGCFPAGTPVWLAGQGCLPIEQIWPGEVVAGVGAEGPVAAAAVHVGLHVERPLLRVEFDGGGEPLLTTPDQPLLVDGAGFVRAKAIESGMAIVGLRSARNIVRRVEPLAESDLVYELSVPGPETYAVGARGLVAHNAPVPRVTGAILRLRALRNLPSRLTFKPSKLSTRTIEVLHAAGRTPSGRTQTYAMVRLKPKAGWTRTQTRMLVRKLNNFMKSGEQRLVGPKTERTSNTHMLQEALAEKYGMTVAEIKAMGIDVDHMTELCAGGQDLTADFLKAADDLKDLGIELRADFLWALDPSVNRSAGSRIGRATSKLRRLQEDIEAPVILVGIVAG